MNATATPAADRITLYHREHAKRQRKKSLQHLVPAVVLVMSALEALSGKERITWVTAAEFVVGVAYLVLLVREWRHLKQHPHHHEQVAWLEVAAAGILALEGYHIWHRHHEAELPSGVTKVHILPYIYWALAAAFIALAFQLPRLTARRHLHLHDDGFSGRLKLWSSAFQFRWDEVATVEPEGVADLVVHRHNGQRQRLSFAQLHDGVIYRNKLVAHFAATHPPA